jgi:hypothetical protein
MKRNVLILACILCFGATDRAAEQASARTAPRSVNGRVVVGGTARPLGYVRAFIDGSRVGSMSNDSGVFRLRDVPAGEMQLALQHPCYLPVRVALPAEGDVAVTIGLPPNRTAAREAPCSGAGSTPDTTRDHTAANRIQSR